MNDTDTDELVFLPEDTQNITDVKEVWNVLIVDDDHEVHSISKLALKDFIFQGKKIKFTSSYSEAQTKELLDTTDTEFALILLDVVMENNNSGLVLVEYIRNIIKAKDTRIIIRTGQPGEAPERYVIENYDINDYKEKTELTKDRLFTAVRTALSDYSHLLELLNKKNELYNKLITHPLTLLGNRFKLNNDLDIGTPHSLLLINIDSFSDINDAYGFAIGDNLLKEVARLLSKVTAKKGIVYHLEADKFAILLTSDLDETKIVSMVQDEICCTTFLVNSIEIHLTSTIGIVQKEFGNIIQKAEIALRHARSLSRNRVQYYLDDLETIEAINLNTKWNRWLRQAMRDDKIFPYFQPIIECKSGEIYKYEALVRLEKDGEVFTPIHFLKTARYAGLLFDITKIMIEKSCAKFSGTNLKFSINLSDQDLISEHLLSFIDKTIKKYTIASNQISFEILENTSISNNKLIANQLAALSESGFELIIDDFGVECSNFAQLRDCDVSTIKIDGIFIKDINEDKDSSLITETVLFLSKRIGLKTVAEFVHNEDVYKRVCALGIDYAQGYYLGKPLPELN